MRSAARTLHGPADPGSLVRAAKRIRRCGPPSPSRNLGFNKSAGIAAVVELLAEPFYVIASTQLRFGLRAGIDTAGMLLRGAVTLALLLRSRLPPALVFSAAQLAFAGLYLLGYLAFAAALAAKVGPALNRCASGGGAAAGGGAGFPLAAERCKRGACL